ncbi:MAG: 50S ribosomal protein L25 [Planctomycetota bacterium]|nr:50S ribosomal protein L25 [Planctomycetota bacterium]MDI6787358.1 50S ribosomal protein L25 [Planctomycetota bacterium]
MEISVVKVERRDKKGSKECRRLRRNNLVPAVLYGGKGKNEMLLLDKKEAGKLIGYGTRLIELTLPDGTEKVIVKELKYNAFQESISHIDFTRVAMDELITIQVEIILKGIPKGAKEGGVLEHTLKHINIKCLPTAIPDKIEVDVSGLEMNALLRVKDLVLPPGITTNVNPNVTVVGIHMPKVEEVAPAPAEAVLAEPEVITQKKPAEETEGAKDEKEKKDSSKEHKPRT